MAGALSEDDWRELYSGILRVLPVRDTSTQRQALAPLARVYRHLDDEGRAAFLRRAASELGVDPEAARAAAERLLEDPADPAAQVAMRRALSPRFADLLHLLTGLPRGVKLLVDLRADLRHLLRDELPTAELELEEHLAAVFDVGLLQLEQITWGSPADLLEKLIEYEAVHEIHGWDDLRSRLADDRRCFAFLHPAMPGEPVVFVEIALTTGTPTSMAELLERSGPRLRPEEADTAVFYSITSCQPGLAGINLGNELLKTVVGRLRSELPNLRRFVTLSPIPTLRAADLDLAPEVRAELDDGRWLDGDDARVREPLLRATARYLTTLDGGRVRDPVANFHLSNGALVDALRWRANTADYGIADSWGVMVSYRYDPERIAANAAAYDAGEAVPVSEEIEALLA